eukprot:IDg11530t1
MRTLCLNWHLRSSLGVEAHYLCENQNWCYLLALVVVRFLSEMLKPVVCSFSMVTSELARDSFLGTQVEARMDSYLLSAHRLRGPFGYRNKPIRCKRTKKSYTRGGSCIDSSSVDSYCEPKLLANLDNAPIFEEVDFETCDPVRWSLDFSFEMLKYLDKNGLLEDLDNRDVRLTFHLD